MVVAVIDIPYAKDAMNLKAGSKIPPRKFYFAGDRPPRLIAPRINYTAKEAEAIERCD